MSCAWVLPPLADGFEGEITSGARWCPSPLLKSHLNISKGEEKSNDINRLAVIQELQANIEAVGTVESAVNTAVTTTSQGNPFKLEKLT